jgi:uncharacterized surface protein with fasciclin (FAS1) repeats
LLLSVSSVASAQRNPRVAARRCTDEDDRRERRQFKDHTRSLPPLRQPSRGHAERPGPFTVFAPTNAAFAKCRPAPSSRWYKREQGHADHILTYHVVPGTMTSKDIARAIKAGRGTANADDVHGGTLTAG